MLRKLVFLVAFVLLNFNAKSDDLSTDYSAGLYGGALINMHTADFKKIPDCPSCSPGYKSGFGGGFSFGALFDYKLSPLFSLGARVSMNNISALLKSEEATKIIVDGVPTDGAFQHTIDTKLTNLGIEPLFKIAFFNQFNLHIGFFAGFLLDKQYAQKEEIVKPAGSGTFVDGFGVDTKSRTRNVFSGDLKDAATIMLAPCAGLSYSLPLNSSRSLNLEPEVFYYLGLTNIVNSPEVNSWKANYLRLGLALRYTFQKEKEIIKKFEKIRKFDTITIKKALIAQSYFSKGVESVRSDEKNDGEILLTTEITSRTDTLFMPRKYELTADITAVGVDEKGNEIQNPKVVVEEFVSNKLKPLLNYIFFSENSSEIPARYNLLNKTNVEKFRINDLYSLGTLDIYYNILNIIGRRMSDNSGMKLRIVGCNADVGKEESNKELSGKRAGKVKDYLVSIWNIEDSRIALESRNLPEKASTPVTDVETSEENRRVEFYSNDYEILSPVFLADTMRRANPPVLRFYPDVKSEAGVKTWSVSARQETNLILTNFLKDGNDAPPKILDWEVAGNYTLTPRLQKPVNYQFKVKDKMGNETQSEVKTLQMDLVTIRKKREMDIQDKIIENFSLILFDFAQWDISGTNKKIVEFIKNRIKDESTISIEGFTDRIGEQDFNTKLSEKRAVSVKNAIGRKESNVLGVGEDKLLYNNDIPEGRFYCRTVDIKVETPVKK